MQISPNETSYMPTGSPPAFRVETEGRLYFSIQLATNAMLLNGANAARRTDKNYFDSWYGDSRVNAPNPRQGPRDKVPPQPLEAPTGRATYFVPSSVWQRMTEGRTTVLFYRLTVFSDARRTGAKSSVADADWKKAPSVTVARLPVRPTRSSAAAFRGRGVLSRASLIDDVLAQLAGRCAIYGRDGDWRFAFIDAVCGDMIVVECHEKGLTDTIAAMPRKPMAVINGQFLSSAFGIGTEGQVIREGTLINADSRSARYYVAQRKESRDQSQFRFGAGDPATAEPEARVAFGGLGPVLLGRAAVSPLTPFAKSVYDQKVDVGRGVIAIRRDVNLILLMVQENFGLFSSATNGMDMTALRAFLLRLGFDDVVFNDGSDSEALFVGSGGWLLAPGLMKNETMDFAVGFVDRQTSRRVRMLAIDGTKSTDAQALIDGLARPSTTLYAPSNLAPSMSSLPSMSGISSTFSSGIIEAWRAPASSQAAIIEQVVELGGASPGLYADFFYLSSHSSRHGELWYYADDDTSAPHLNVASLWSPSFAPVWKTRPVWVILAGCAVLALRYSRGLRLSTAERGHLEDWHRDIHGAGAAVPGLTPAKQTLMAVYHPGWAWHSRVFARSPGLRGVLGYWYRSPGHGRDVDIAQDLAQRLGKGEAILAAWEAANKGGWFEAEALWAAMVRRGCEKDTLATMESATLAPVGTPFCYFDKFQRGREMADAYRTANLRPDVESIGGVRIRCNPDYDRLALGELRGLSVSPTTANFLAYDDGVGP